MPGASLDHQPWKGFDGKGLDPSGGTGKVATGDLGRTYGSVLTSELLSTHTQFLRDCCRLL